MKQREWLSPQQQLGQLAVDVTSRSLRVREVVQGVKRRESGEFPGMQPVSLCASNIQLLTSSYVVAVKTDGIRALLTLLPGDSCVYLTARDMRTYCLRSTKKQQLFPSIGVGLLYQLDGELLCYRKKKRLQFRYVPHDVLTYRSQCVEPLLFQDRLRCIEQLLQGCGYSRTETTCFRVQSKSFLSLQQLRQLQQQTQLPTDGFIFQSLHTPYRRGTCRMLLKWKPSSCNSVDFRILVQREPEPHHFSLSYQCCDGREIQRQRVHTATQEAEDRCLALHGRIVECVPVDGKWLVTRIRDDKLQPNAHNTYLRVLQSIQDGIGWSQLLESIQRICA